AAAGAAGASGLSGTFRTDQLTVDGAARPLAPAGLTIEFEAGRIRANAGCNTMSGTATVSGDTIAVDDMASTEMGCEAAAQESDAIVAELLTGRPTFRLDGSTLTLSGKRTAATLQRADTAAGQVALTGTTWTLDTLISGATASSLPASERAAPTLRIDGTNLVLNACNAMTGTATVTEQHLSVGALAQTKMSCGADLDRLETTIAETLAQPLTVEIADGRLTLTAPDGSGLGFAAADGPQPDPAAR
ncbi:MAG TPA: META domain-containing protein, partial [Microthrixaceae bacterium]|nr:META domain-containing protein [Microthrixaceae bacterium]